MLNILKKYINKRIEFLKIELTEMTARMISILIYIFIALTIAMMFLFLISLAIGLTIGIWLNNTGLGIFIFSLVYLIIFIIIITNYEKIRSLIMAKIIEFQLNSTQDEEKLDEE